MHCSPFHPQKQFYDEAIIFISYSIDEILGIFEIDGSDLPIRVRNKIKKQLISWNGDSDDIVVECDQEFRCRIQHNRMRALEKLSKMHFERIRKILPSLSLNRRRHYAYGSETFHTTDMTIPFVPY